MKLSYNKISLPYWDPLLGFHFRIQIFFSAIQKVTEIDPNVYLAVLITSYRFALPSSGHGLFSLYGKMLGCNITSIIGANPTSRVRAVLGAF